MDRPLLPSNVWIPLEPSGEDRCPYLADRLSSLDAGLIAPDPTGFDDLMARGFRRQGLLFYRPSCLGCAACVPIRVPVESFRPTRSQRRLLRRTEGRYTVEVGPVHYDPAHYAMYAAHAQQVSAENRPSRPAIYRASFLETLVQTHQILFRVDGELAAVTILDEGASSVSSVYAFWDARFADLSPGTFSALWEIEWARANGKRYYYLGYWVEACERMVYKARFRPHELYDWANARWYVAPE